VIVDVHAHFLPPVYRAALADAGIDRPDGFPYVPGWSADGAIEAMARHGIDAALLSLSSPGVAFARDPAGLARAVNEAGAEAVRAHSRSFGLLACLPLPDVDAAAEAIRVAADDLGAEGFVLMTNYDGTYLGDPRFDPVMAELDRRGALTALHPTSPPQADAVSLGKPRPMLEFPFDTTRAVVNLVLSGTLRRFPRIRMIVPHAGAALPVLADRVQGFTRAFGEDVDVHSALRGLYYDLAGDPLPHALPALLRLAGHEQVLYGSDTPFNPAAGIAAGIYRLRSTDTLAEDERRAVLGANARRLIPRLGAA
jgi:predicted TIM-barrel fold metal-dependent hydrolase